MFSYHKTSEYHEKCVPANLRKQAEESKAAVAPGGKPIPQSALTDAVTTDKIWKQAVKNESTGAQQWEENWGFMTEYDSKGRPQTPKELPDKVNMFSDGTVPDTNAGIIGSRLQTDLGMKMQSMEFQFNSSRRKRKLGSEMVCY